jgi:sugar O-acyltransferase (sialic acid O-acetyltransferase NeuD family)
MTNKICIIGAGGLGREFLQAFHRASLPVSVFVDDNIKENTIINGTSVIGGIDKVSELVDNKFILALGNPSIKEQTFLRLNLEINRFLTFIHPTAISDISLEDNIGFGTYIGALSIFTADIKIGNNCLINSGCNIHHDTIIGDFSTLMPGVKISSKCTIGRNVYIGTGAIISKIIDIPDNSIIPAGSILN